MKCTMCRQGEHARCILTIDPRHTCDCDCDEEPTPRKPEPDDEPDDDEPDDDEPPPGIARTEQKVEGRRRSKNVGQFTHAFTIVEAVPAPPPPTSNAALLLPTLDRIIDERIRKWVHIATFPTNSSAQNTRQRLQKLTDDFDLETRRTARGRENDVPTELYAQWRAPDE